MFAKDPLNDRQTKLWDTLASGSLADIVVFIADSLYWMWSEEAALTLAKLHERFGNGGPEAAVLHDSLRELKRIARNGGLAYFWNDKLAQDAGTVQDPPDRVTLRDVALYLESRVTLHNGAVQLYQAADTDAEDVFVHIDTAILNPSVVGTLMRVFREALPAPINIAPLPAVPPAGSDIAAMLPAYDLTMAPAWAGSLTVPWASVIRDAPAGVTQEDGSVGVTTTIVQKSADAEEGDAEEERYVLNYVLIPNNLDSQDHVITKEEVRKACHWWAENAGNKSFALHHVLQGGEQAEEGAIVMLENFLLPTEVTYGDTTLPEGTWMLGARINDDDIWEQVKAGEFNAWSIGAMTYLDPIEDDATAADDS